MKNSVLIVLLALSVLIISHSAFAESWKDSLIIQAPQHHDVLKAELSDVECVALAIYFEARGEPTLGQELLAQLVVNRARDFQYDDTMCDVVRAPAQFSWTRDGKSDLATDLKAYETSFIMAIEYLFMGKVAPVPYATEILNVHATHDEFNQPVNPNWHDRREVTRVGRQIFFVRA